MGKKEERKDKYKADEMEFESSPLDQMKKVSTQKNEFTNIASINTTDKKKPQMIGKKEVEVNKKNDKSEQLVMQHVKHSDMD